MARISIKELDNKLTKKELKELQNAEKKAADHDEISEMTPEKLREFKRLHDAVDRNKHTVSLRVSSTTLDIAKAYGKGYTAFLSRLLDEAIKNEELVKKCI
jgi:uncharacterized protein (DUF4415 family)